MPHLIDIDPHGRLVPQDDAARRMLADRAGRFLLLPSAHDLLVARRRPAAGGGSPRPRCVVAGDLAAFPIADLVAFIHQSRLSGLLTVSAGGTDRSVAFKDGEVRGASSDAPGERLGDVAVALGYLRSEQVAEADETQGRQLGKVLVERGFVSPQDLRKCLHEMVAAVFHSILLSREGVFDMTDAGEVDLGTPLSVNTESLLMDGIRRIDEMSLFRSRIPDARACLRRREPRVPITLKPVEQQLLDLVDGQRTVADVARGAHLNEFDATKILHHLSQSGYLESQAAPTAAASPAARLEAIAAAMNDILLEIAAALARAGSLEPALAAARAFLADPAERYSPLWKMSSIDRAGGLDIATVLGNCAALKGTALTRIEPSGDLARFLLDGLRELMFVYLFHATERLPRDTYDRLGREVKHRFDALAESR